jgi:FtsP/CotA-like multicopper oxidase with cupredoxin domain
MRHSAILLAGFLTLIHVNAQGDDLVQPSTIESSSGILDTTVTIEYGDFSGPDYSVTNTRLLNGLLPGPILRLNAGDTLRILFRNELQLQDGAVSGADNEFTDPDHSNLHFHGGHVSGELPSDDIRMAVAPGDEYQYETVFPENHMPGTHWIHPHVHGSSALQLGGGAAMSFIVNDPADFLPTQVEDAEEILLFIQHIDRGSLNRVKNAIGDSMLGLNFQGETEFRLVNGQYQPTVTMQPGEWQRWRIVWGNWGGDRLNAHFNDSTNCEMQLLAKDGIYIQDYPRSITSATIPTGGRADVMVRCSAAGTYEFLDFEEKIMLTVSVTGSTLSSSDLSAWTPDYPAYLTDLTSTSPTNGCDCETAFRGCDDEDKTCVNGELFDKSLYIHTVEFGSVVEREIRGIANHPYHQHVYPFQLVDGVDNLSDADENTYFQTGDWHDVISMDTNNAVTGRYVADVHDGVIMLHCHILAHEDEGTMAQELVVDGGSCACDILYKETSDDSVSSPTSTPTPSPTPLCRKDSSLIKSILSKVL